MKIKISKIETGSFTVRDDVDREHVKRIAESLKQDGQWNPIIVKPKDNNQYEVISGHYRLQAAKELGWSEIEATVKDLSQEESDVLALKTNMVRKNMSELEEAKVIKELLDKHDLTQKEVGEKLNRSASWVGSRLSLALDVVEYVQEKISSEEISPEHGVLISRLPEEKQKEFTKRILEKNLTRDETRKELARFKNDTIYTIGYQGKNFEEFLEILKNNDIKQIIDIRKSSKSQYKPEFNGDILNERLKNENIEYKHLEGLGIPHVIRAPYMGEFIGFECLENWYQWWVKEESTMDFVDFINGIKDEGKTVLMCMEKYAEPKRDQNIYCHRHILANMFQEKIEDEVLFPNRVDL